MIEGAFNFADYFSTTQMAKRPVDPIMIRDGLNAKSINYFVSEYR
jgi:hypothetical protein